MKLQSTHLSILSLLLCLSSFSFSCKKAIVLHFLRGCSLDDFTTICEELHGKKLIVVSDEHGVDLNDLYKSLAEANKKIAQSPNKLQPLSKLFRTASKDWKVESVIASTVLPGNGESEEVIKIRGDLRVEVKIRNVTKNTILINSLSSPLVQLSSNESVTKTEIDAYFRTYLNSNGQMCGPASYTSIAPNETYSFVYRDSSRNEGKQMNLTFIGEEQSNIMIGPYTLKRTKMDSKTQ